MFAASANSNREMPASLPTEYDTLTPEQAAALGHYRARWAAIRRSTEPADRNAAEQGVRHAYHAAALKPPVRCVWCEGPAALSDLTQRIARTDGANVKSALMPSRAPAGCLSRPEARVSARVGRCGKRGEPRRRARCVSP